LQQIGSLGLLLFFDVLGMVHGTGAQFGDFGCWSIGNNGWHAIG
jgi:hypothetical protein